MMIRSFFIGALALAGAVMSSVAFAQPPAAGPTTPPAQAAQPGVALSGPTDMASADYVLGRDDVLEVGLLGRNDFGGRARVQADGTIQLPFVGKVPAADRTSGELSEAIRKALQAGGYFSDPVVVVEVVNYASRYVTVLGAVGSPGLVPMNRPYRLSEIIARVGGVRDAAADHILVRSANGQEKRVLVRDLSTGDVERDPFVSPGDKIFAPQAELFYIYGQINSPGAYPLLGEMTLRMAIARSGGLTASGSEKKVTVIREGKKVKVAVGDKIQAGDVLQVGERLF